MQFGQFQGKRDGKNKEKKIRLVVAPKPILGNRVNRVNHSHLFTKSELLGLTYLLSL